MSLLSDPLQAFTAIAKHKTVHGAANAIHLTQTAVTQRIRVLERKLRTTLFIRTRRGMMLTAEGEALLRYCQSILSIEGETLAKIKTAGIEAEITITITGPTSIMRSRVIPQCSRVMNKFKNLLMHFDINDREMGVKALRSGESQFAIIQPTDIAPEMASKILRPERYVLVCTSAWKKRKLKEIIKSEHIIDYDPTDKMTFDYLKHYNLFDCARHSRHFANRTDALAALIVSGQGYGLLTSEFSKNYLEQNQLIVLNSGKVYESSTALAWYARHESPKYFLALINAIT
jgi:LysR family transcriptional regulator (chromosome initiation inhibitor)